MITGHDDEADYPSAIVAGNPEGISVSFNPIGWQSAPPTGTFTVTIAISSAVPSGTYFVVFNDTLLPGGETCSGTCIQPVYTIHVDPQGTQGITVQLTLQDSVNATGTNALSANAQLSDAVNVSGTYKAPVTAILSDAVRVAGSYVAPAVAALTDVVNAADSYIAPVTASLSDAVNILDQLTKASPQAATVLGIGLLGAGLIGLVLSRKKPEKDS